MALIDTFLARRSVRSFTSEPVSREALETIVTAGLSGPVGRGTTPWKLFVIEDKAAVEKLGGVREPRQPIFDTATAAIAVFGNPEISDTWIENCSVALTNMHLEASALGLGSCWIQGRGRTAATGQTSNEFIHSVLDVPAEFKLEALLLIGNPQQQPVPRAKNDVDLSFVVWESK